MTETPWFTASEAAKYLKISEGKLYALVREGTLAARRAGRVTRYHRDDLDGVFTPVAR